MGKQYARRSSRSRGKDSHILPLNAQRKRSYARRVSWPRYGSGRCAGQHASRRRTPACSHPSLLFCGARCKELPAYRRWCSTSLKHAFMLPLIVSSSYSAHHGTHCRGWCSEPRGCTCLRWRCPTYSLQPRVRTAVTPQPGLTYMSTSWRPAGSVVAAQRLTVTNNVP